MKDLKKAAIRELVTVQKETGYSLEAVIEFIKNIPDSYDKDEENSSIDLENRIAKILKEVGIPASIKGYNYIKQSIILVYNDETLLHTMMRLYASVAELYGTSSTKVERSIRHAIEIAFNRGNFELLEDIFSFTVSRFKDKSTNSEFIAGLYQYLRHK